MTAGPRIILITAGAKGIGRAICQSFHAAGDKVYFVDNDSGAGIELGAYLSGSVFIECDIANQNDVSPARQVS